MYTSMLYVCKDYIKGPTPASTDDPCRLDLPEILTVAHTELGHMPSGRAQDFTFLFGGSIAGNSRGF